MAAPAAALSIRFKILGGMGILFQEDDGAVSPAFDAASTTWADIMRTRVNNNSREGETVFRVNVANKSYVIGIDIPLGATLAEWAEVLGMTAAEPVKLIMEGVLSIRIEYEKVMYALAAHTKGLPWPLWDAQDTDCINMQVLGSWDNMRERRGSTMTPPADHNNNLVNLVGLRHGRHLYFINMHALKDYVRDHGEGLRDPLHRHPIANARGFKEKLDICVGLSRRPPVDRMSSLLPIIDLDTLAIDRKYGSAFAAEERRMAQVPKVAGLRMGEVGPLGMIKDALYEELRALLGKADTTDAALERRAREAYASWRAHKATALIRAASEAEVIQIAKDLHAAMLPAVPALSNKFERMRW